MQKMSREEMSVLLEENLRNKMQDFLNEYQGEGERLYDFSPEGNEFVQKVVMTDRQKRTHDRQYRERLIQEGHIKPRQKTAFKTK